MRLILLVYSRDCSRYGGHFASFQVSPHVAGKYEEQTLKYEEKGDPLIVVVLFLTLLFSFTVFFVVFAQYPRGGIEFSTNIFVNISTIFRLIYDIF